MSPVLLDVSVSIQMCHAKKGAQAIHDTNRDLVSRASTVHAQITVKLMFLFLGLELAFVVKQASEGLQKGCLDGI